MPGTSKMCFGLHSVTVKSMQIVFMLFFKKNILFYLFLKETKRSEQGPAVV